MMLDLSMISRMDGPYSRVEFRALRQTLDVIVVWGLPQSVEDLADGQRRRVHGVVRPGIADLAADVQLLGGGHRSGRTVPHAGCLGQKRSRVERRGRRVAVIPPLDSFHPGGVAESGQRNE